MHYKKLFWYAIVSAALFFTGCFSDSHVKPTAPAGAEYLSIDLAGPWDFRVDPGRTGREQKWFEQTGFDDTIHLPGSMTENGFGEDVTADTQWTGSMWNNTWRTEDRYQKYREPGNVKISFWLQPLKYYVGPAWYQREITIPENWAGKQVMLLLERCHWETEVWVDGKRAGMENSLSTPNRFVLYKLSPGKHRITICVDNTLKIDVGMDAHSVSDNTQTNWNGIVGALQLLARDGIQIADLQVYPDGAKKQAVIRGTVLNKSIAQIKADITLEAQTVTGINHKPDTVKQPFDLGPGENTFEIVFPMGDEYLKWDEFAPNVYQMSATVVSEDSSDTKTVSFGMRELRADGNQFMINGRKLFFRGTLECAIFPLTGYPPTAVEEWARIITVAKSYGLNHFRFHSWCPPRAAFTAADQLGFYFQVEGPFWAKIGDGGDLDTYIYAECDKILEEYGNHPSFLLMAYGNEPSGDKHEAFLGKLVNTWRSQDPRHLYSSASGWPHIPENEYHIDPGPRIQHWGAGLTSRINAKEPETVTDYSEYISKFQVPVISHEIGQWCVYPNFNEMQKYTGVTRPKNFEIFRESLENNFMLDQAQDFIMASGKLQALCYKEDIESALRTPGFGGFQLLDLHDFPGQGTALVGVVDPFWEGKDYITAGEYHRFACETVPLARMTKRIWTNDEIFTADIEIAHFGAAPITNARINWKLMQRDQAYNSGVFAINTIPIGTGIQLGRVEAALNRIIKAAKMTLVVGLEGTDFENEWDIWVYPKTLDSEITTDIFITEALDEQALSVLNSGGKVMLLPSAGTVQGDVSLGFSSIFWNTSWTRGQEPHTLGILCDPKHPALAEFPTEYHSNWQWWYMMTNEQAMVLNKMPSKLRPIVQIVDDWFTNRRLGLVFEAIVNGGKLLVCSIDLRKDLDKRPVARQMFYSLKKYMQSKKFNPEYSLQAALVNDLMKKPPDR